MSPVVTARDGIGALIGHLGAGTCARLNVNAGSMANIARTGTPGIYSQDMVLVANEPYMVHVEPDKTLVMPWGSLGTNRGPYVHHWDGATFTLVGGASLDPLTDIAPAADGDRWGPHNPRIATDGGSVFVAYYDWIVTDIITGESKAHIRISKLVAGAWVEVAQEAIAGGDDGNLGGSVISLTVAGGIAYAVYSTNTSRRVRIFRSDGTGTYVDGSGHPTVGYSQGYADGTYVAVTTSGGRPVGIYTKQQLTAGSLVCFDLTTGLVIREDPTPAGVSTIVPYGTNRQTSNVIVLSGSAFSGYGDAGGQIVCGTNSSTGCSGILVVPEDFSEPPVAIDGSDVAIFGFDNLACICSDSTDARQIWMTSGTSQDVSGGIARRQLVRAWQPSCQSARVVGNPVNSLPPYDLYTEAEVPLDGAPDSCLFANDNVWGISGPAAIVCDGTYLYVFWLYIPDTDFGGDGTLANQNQWIVSRWTISRDSVPCAAYVTPSFASRHKVAAGA